MKKLNKYILIISLSLFLMCPFLIPISKAQEWIYDGVDTEKIPNHSVYPSEWYVFAQTLLDPDILSIGEIEHGNITDLGPGPGYCVYGNGYLKNITSGALTPTGTDVLISYWNETIGFIGGGSIIPVEADGKVSERILSNVSYNWEVGMLSSYTFENKQIYPMISSFAFWNTSNNAYIYFNYTEDGILEAENCYSLPFGNLTLYSQPAQLPPVFSFAPEHSGLIVNSTSFILNIDINSADNNNDGVTDTDYSMRHFQDSTWSSWGTPPSQLLWNLGPGAAPGNYTITIEIKNMYGTTQEQIEIQYEPPKNGEPPIPGYSAILISIATLLGVSFLILKNRLKE